MICWARLRPVRRSLGRLVVAAVLAADLGCATDQPQNPAENNNVAGPTAAAPLTVKVVEQTEKANPNSINRFGADFGANGAIVTRDGHAARDLPDALGPDLRPPVAKTGFRGEGQAGFLVLYDTTSKFGWLGELFAMCAKTLLSHFGPVTAKPVSTYAAGEIDGYQGLLYIGSSFDEPLSVQFLDDVLQTEKPVMWIYDNIWQLQKRAKDFGNEYGFTLTWFDLSSIQQITYKGATLTRDASNESGLVEVKAVVAEKYTILATAVRKDGTTLPWAVRAKNLFFIAENPFGYISENDRYIAFSDLLFEAFAPKTTVQHRALVRLEDVNPSQDPKAFREMVDFFYSEKVPFSMALIPLYVDALGAQNGGVPITLRWIDRPAMLTAIKYATLRGGTIVQHGYTHQYEKLKNPYSGVTADDFEFFLTHVDKDNSVIYDGPVPNDSASWAIGRIQAGLAELQSAGLQQPVTFEYPHYAGSSVDSKAIRTVFKKAYHRGLFFGGDLGKTPADNAHNIGLFYPFKVTDVYDWVTTPENLGNFEPLEYNNHPPRSAADLIQSAKNNLVIRDGVASFFYHPYYPLSELKATVLGIKKLGYQFVAGDAL